MGTIHLGGDSIYVTRFRSSLKESLECWGSSILPGLSGLNLTRCFHLLAGFLFLEDLGYDSDEMRSKLLPKDPKIKGFLGSFSIPIDWQEMWRIHVEDQKLAHRMMQAILKSWMLAEHQFLLDCYIASVPVLGEMKGTRMNLSPSIYLEYNFQNGTRYVKYTDDCSPRRNSSFTMRFMRRSEPGQCPQRR